MILRKIRNYSDNLAYIDAHHEDFIMPLNASTGCRLKEVKEIFAAHVLKSDFGVMPVCLLWLAEHAMHMPQDMTSRLHRLAYSLCCCIPSQPSGAAISTGEADWTEER
jgi:hypothetical protein